MAKYLMTWKVVQERLADDVQTIAQGWQQLLGMVQADLEAGKMKDWGAFPGENEGYSILEGDEMDVMAATVKYAPFVTFRVRPVVSAGQVAGFLSAVAG